MRNSCKEVGGIFHSHFKNIADGFSLVENFKGFTVESFSMTYITLYKYIRQEVHFNCDCSGTLTVFTASTLYVETETSRFVPLCLCFRHGSIKLADLVKDTDVSDRIAARSTADRALIYVDDLVDVLKACDFLI